MKRILFLEWVRGTAASMVVLFHLLDWQWPWFHLFSREWLDLGRVGVVAFFLVSGYVIPLSLQKQRVRVFLVRRVFRLYPTYVVALTLFVAVYYWSRDAHTGAWWLVVLVNYTMFQGLVGIALLLGPSWTLSIEWVFYAQQAIARRFDLLDRGWFLAYFWLAIYVVACLLERISGQDLPTTIPMLLAVSCVGHAWYLVHNGRLSLSRFISVLVVLVVLVCAGATVAVDEGDLWNPVNYSLSFLLGIVWFAAAFALRNRLRAPVLVWLGSVSYAIYLFHPVVREVIYLFVAAPLWLVILLNVVLVPLVAWLVHKFVEIPFVNLARRLTSKRSPDELPRDNKPSASPAA